MSEQNPTPEGADPVEQASVRSRKTSHPDMAELEGIVDLDTLDPDMHYRFGHERPQRQARLKAKGYRVVKVSQDKVKPVLEDMVGPDDTIRDGDTVLMCCPQERWKGRRRQLAETNRARLAAPKGQFRKKTRGAAPGGEDVRVVTADKTDR